MQRTLHCWSAALNIERTNALYHVLDFLTVIQPMAHCAPPTDSKARTATKTQSGIKACKQYQVKPRANLLQCQQVEKSESSKMLQISAAYPIIAIFALS
jgi:hypothetical protein